MVKISSFLTAIPAIVPIFSLALPISSNVYLEARTSTPSSAGATGGGSSRSSVSAWNNSYQSYSSIGSQHGSSPTSSDSGLGRSVSSSGSHGSASSTGSHHSAPSGGGGGGGGGGSHGNGGAGPSTGGSNVSKHSTSEPINIPPAKKVNR